MTRAEKEQAAMDAYQAARRRAAYAYSCATALAKQAYALGGGRVLYNEAMARARRTIERDLYEAYAERAQALREAQDLIGETGG